MSKTKNTGLGKGLEAVFLDNSMEFSDGTTLLRISDLEPNNKQPRKSFDIDALSKLADSIAAHGVIQPIVVRTGDAGFYTIIAGERRWRAAKMAGLSEVPAIVMDIDDAKAAEIALVENLQREDLNPLEEAAAYRTLIEEFGLTQEEVSRRIGKSRAAITNTLRLLELPAEIENLLISGDLSAGHARALLGLKNNEKMKKAAETIAKNELSVRATEELVRKLNSAEEVENIDIAKKSDETRVDYLSELEKKVLASFGRKIKIHSNGKKKKIEIEFADDHDLESIIEQLCGKNIFED